MLLARSYSHFSLLSAVPKIPALIQDAKNKGYKAIALTDEDTTSGLVEFYDACLKQEIKPILGVTLRIATTLEQSGFQRHAGFSKIALLAKNEPGYKNILELVTLARTVQEEPSPHINLENLSKYRTTDGGLNFYVVLTGSDHEYGVELANNRIEKASQILLNYANSLGAENVLVELLNKNDKDNAQDIQKWNLDLAELCNDSKVKLIASPAPRYLNPEDRESFEVVLAIKNQTRVYDISLDRSFELPNLNLLKETFGYLPKATEFEALIETFEIQIRTDYASKASEAFFPPVDLKDNQTYDDLLTWNTYLGLITKFHQDQKTLNEWEQIYPYERLFELKELCAQMPIDATKLVSYPSEYWQKSDRINEYIQQVERELEIIKNKGYSSYFIVVADLAQYCKRTNITASARGSGAGSLIGYLNNISTADTVFYKIPFERFLNPLRPSAPDVDLDVADDKRQSVIAYLINKYGQERVSQVVTYGTMLPRAAIRDIGRVLGISYRKCDQLSKLIPSPPFGKKPSFKYAFETSAELKEVYEKDDEVTRMIDIAKRIEGNYRHASVHAAAVLVTPTKTSDYCSLQWDSNHELLVCQYDWHDCEKIGILPCKMDILGITNLSILSNSIELVEKYESSKIDLFNINLNDPKVYSLLSEGRTMGIFQLSSSGMTRYIMQLKPTKVEDIMAMVALYRPGAMNSIPEFIRRKNNPELIKYYVPEMKEWMEETYGILVYQEDIMYTFMRLAGYNFGKADNIRRAMGKKDKEVLDKEYANFLAGCEEHGLNEEKIKELWDLIVPFTDYSFNKAHSAAYGIVAYWTAFMKANYPAEFMTALMTSEEGDMNKIGEAIAESKAMGLQVLPPDVNKSTASYSIENSTTIRYGLSSVKNLGSDVIKFIIEDREKSGNYKNFEDFIGRMSNINSFNKRSVEALILCGALDEICGELI